jgi:hypothetical protein
MGRWREGGVDGWIDGWMDGTHGRVGDDPTQIELREMIWRLPCCCSSLAHQ